MNKNCSVNKTIIMQSFNNFIETIVDNEESVYYAKEDVLIKDMVNHLNKKQVG